MAWLPRFLRRLSPLFFLVPLALGTALALARTSYRSAQQLAERAERSLDEPYQLLGSQYLERVDNYIIDSDRQFFNLVDLEHLSDFARQLTTFRTSGPDGLGTLLRFGRFFAGELWEVYGPDHPG